VTVPDSSSQSSGVPKTLRLDEPSGPKFVAQRIVTLSSDDISRFFVRVRRDQDTEKWEVRLDAALREILERANDFVPSEAGGILLDDPRAKFAGSTTPRLTFIATFGPGAAERLGQRVPSDRGICGEVYQSGRPFMTDAVADTDPLAAQSGGEAPGAGAGAGAAPPSSAAGEAPLDGDGPPISQGVPSLLDPSEGTITALHRRDEDDSGSFPHRPVQSIIAVPVIVGDSICGVLELTNRLSGTPYSASDKELLRIFAAYISSSIQNALDAIRNRILARIDDLTGLYNSRYFHMRLRDELARADRDGTDLGVLFIDLDQLKSINDRFGHIAGSAILRDVARAMTEEGLPGSVVSRYGGDEFVVILPGTKLAQSLHAAERLRRAIAAAHIPDPSDTKGRSHLPRVTASLGVASYRDHLSVGGTAPQRENALLRLADQAMYRAKAAGRDRVEVALPED
jgi:diguanylate cyclase (GGDEF)-like protein